MNSIAKLSGLSPQARTIPTERMDSIAAQVKLASSVEL
jgi:hypothetical protein